jgi:hypothetical protein
MKALKILIPIAALLLAIVRVGKAGYGFRHA